MKTQRFFTICACFLLLSAGCYARKTEVVSPDGRLKLQMACNDSLAYRVFYKGKEIVEWSAAGLTLSDRRIGPHPELIAAKKREVRDSIRPPYGKFAVLSDYYNELTLNFKGGYSLVLRAYDEGVAYRFVTELPGEITLVNEQVGFNPAGNPAVSYPETLSQTAWEVSYIDYENAAAIAEGKRAVTPVLFSRPDGVRVLIAESDVRDYPGMFLVRGREGFTGDFADYPDSTAMGGWYNFVNVVQRKAPYIARTTGSRVFPWRVVIATDDDRTLLTNELIYKLAAPQQFSDVSWIKPGKAAWEWWHDALLPGADVPSGMDNRNTALYKHYIDFAAENGLEYLMLDAGWSNLYDLSKVNPKIDIEELVRYGKSKNVGVFLWCVAYTLIQDTDRYMRMLSDWGVAGLKVDFFERDDQVAMNWYETLAKKAADYRLMLNIHGCSKPTGLQRAYPNIVNFEALRGAECSKWDLTANPEHHLTFPFARMLGGSVDYTPGSMRNRSRQMFKPVDPGLPFSLGTRCHELAMFVVFDQYFAMLCDSPEAYRENADAMRFLSAVPVSFDDTKVLAAKACDYALVAKRKGRDWYVGGMTDWTAREITVDLSFLTPGVRYRAEIYTDGDDAGIYADQYRYETREADYKTCMQIRMAPGGGTAIRLYPIE